MFALNGVGVARVNCLWFVVFGMQSGRVSVFGVFGMQCARGSVLGMQSERVSLPCCGVMMMCLFFCSVLCLVLCVCRNRVVWLRSEASL